MKDLNRELQAELVAKERLGKLANNPNITGFTPQGGKEVLRNIPIIGKSKTKEDKDKDKEVKSESNRLTTVLTGERARQLDTPEKVLAYLESKLVPEAFGDKMVLYIFPDDVTENIAQTEKGLLIHHDDNKQIKFRAQGDKEQVEERTTQCGVVVSIGKGLVTDTGSIVNMHLKVGDIVYVGFYAGAEISYDGVMYKVMREYETIVRVPKKL